MIDEQRFLDITDKIITSSRERYGIGLLAEKNVHAIVKEYYEPDEDHQEIPIEGSVADIYRDGEIIEIQNGNFNKLRTKLTRFLPLYKVTIVYPIPRIRWLIWVDPETGELTTKRKSPRKGTVYDLFPELYKIKSFINDKNFNLEVLLIDMEEYRLLNGWSKDRKKGSTREERVPVHLESRHIFTRKEDYMQLVPYELEEPFTAKEFAKAAKIPLRTAQVAVNILAYQNVIKNVGKRGRAYLYVVEDI